jgi:hypothetical protein
MRRIHLEHRTVSELFDKIKKKWNDPAKGDIIYVYELWDKNKTPITDDARVQNLIQGHELEIVSLELIQEELTL